jgi:hypothetical protein
MAKYLTAAKIAAVIKNVHPTGDRRRINTLLSEIALGDADVQTAPTKTGTTDEWVQALINALKTAGVLV